MSARYMIVCCAVNRCPISRLQRRLRYQGLESVIGMDFWICFAMFCGRYCNDEETSPGFETKRSGLLNYQNFPSSISIQTQWTSASIRKPTE